MSLSSSPPRINKFRSPASTPMSASPMIFPPNRPDKTPRVSLTSDPPKTPSIMEIPRPSEKKDLKRVEEFLGVSPPDLLKGGYALWICPRIYQTVELTDRKEFPLTVRVKQRLSPSTVTQMQMLFKSSWYEPSGLHGVQTDKMEKALERFLIAHYLEEGRFSYEEIKGMKLKKKIEKDRESCEKLISDSC